ncbi:flagellin hook IN motif-containing protein, partial [Comamonas aquatica]|uniref:flagellin hook IN motif-containing protein n=1 Tax=Comamonas aquatica TaxID=225991 RepID=UPI00244CCEEA
AGDNITVGATTKATADGLGSVKFGASSQTVKAGDSADAVLSDLKEVAAGELTIKVGSGSPVELSGLKAASSEQERLGQVAAAINEKSADTGVTAFLTAKGDSYTLEVRSEKGEAVEFGGFTQARTGFEGEATLPAASTATFTAITAGTFTATEKGTFDGELDAFKAEPAWSVIGQQAKVKEALSAYESDGTEANASALLSEIEAAASTLNNFITLDGDDSDAAALAALQSDFGMATTTTAAEVLAKGRKELGLGLDISAAGLTDNKGIAGLDISTQAGAWEAMKQIDSAI